MIQSRMLNRMTNPSDAHLLRETFNEIAHCVALRLEPRCLSVLSLAVVPLTLRPRIASGMACCMLEHARNGPGSIMASPML